MGEISDRIKDIRQKSKESQEAFASKLGVKRSTIAQIEAGNHKPTIELISNIVRNYNTTYQWLVDGIKSEHNLDDSAPTFSPNLLAVTVDPAGKENLVYVDIKARAGYIDGFGDPVFIKKLPAYNLPGYTNATFRMFQVGGFSMLPTLYDSDIVIGRFIEDGVFGIRDNRVHVIVTREDVLVKRVLNSARKSGTVILKSDNNDGDYHPIVLKAIDIVEVWYVAGFVSNQLPPPSKMEQRMNQLEAQLIQIQHILKLKH